MRRRNRGVAVRIVASQGMNPSSESVFGRRINGSDIQPELIIIVAWAGGSEMLIRGNGFSILQNFYLLDNQHVAAFTREMYFPFSRHYLPVTGSRQRTGNYPSGCRPIDAASLPLDLPRTQTRCH